jgi:hypothetical protein
MPSELKGAVCMVKKRGGFLLITAVCLLAIASLMLTQMALRSMSAAEHTVILERELRDRWSGLSLQQYCLTNAEALLSSTHEVMPESSQREPSVISEKANRVSWDVQLNGSSWHVDLVDESVKVNLNVIYGLRPSEEFETLVGKLIGDRDDLAMRGPLERPAEGSNGSKRYEGWFRSTPMDTTGHNGPSFSPETLNRVTLWGNGRLNVRRADDTSVDELLHYLFGRGGTSDFHQRRRTSPQLSLDVLFTELGLRESQAKIARRYFAMESHAYAVWVGSRSSTRTSLIQYVTWTEGGGLVRKHAYAR